MAENNLGSSSLAGYGIGGRYVPECRFKPGSSLTPFMCVNHYIEMCSQMDGRPVCVSNLIFEFSTGNSVYVTQRTGSALNRLTVVHLIKITSSYITRRCLH